MNKRFYKKVVLSMVIVGLTVSYVVPINTFAAVQTVRGDLLQQETNKKYSLGPERLKDTIATMIPSTIEMDSYAQTIRKQQEADLSSINSVNRELYLSLVGHQKNPKMHAEYWFDNIKPHIKWTKQNIVNYNGTFQQQYLNLLDAIDQNDTVGFETTLSKLYQEISENKKDVEDSLKELKTFRNTIIEDTRNFKFDSNRLTSILAQVTFEISDLQKQINNDERLIDSHKSRIINGAVLCTILIGCVAGGPIIADAKDEIATTKKHLKRLKEEISKAKEKKAILDDVKNKTKDITDTIDKFVTSLQNIFDQLCKIEVKYGSLLQNVNSISPEEFDFIREDIKIAKDSWLDLKEYVEKL